MRRVVMLCLLAVLMLANPAWAEPPAEGIWAYWPLSGDVNDYSPNQRDGALHGRVADLPMLGPFAGATHFSGGWVAVPGSDHDGSFSVSAWVFYEGNAAGFSPLIGRVGISGNRMQLAYQPGDRLDTAPLLSDLGLPWRRWSHVAVVWDEPARTMTFWQRGIRITVLAVPAEVAVRPPFGGPFALGGAGFTGRLAEVLVYSRALAPEEILYLADGAGRQTPTQVAISTGCGGAEQGPCWVCRRYQAWPPDQWTDCAGGRTPWCAGNPHASQFATCP